MSDNFYIYSDFSMRCIRQTIRGCSSYRSSRAGWRFGRSGSSGFVVGFRLLRLSSRGLVPRVRVYCNALRQDWRFHAGYGLLAVGGGVV